MDLWFTVKCLSSGKLSTVMGSAIYEITEISPNRYWERKDLSVHTVDEFVQRAAKEKLEKAKRGVGTEYGLVEGKYMFRFKITYVAASKEAVEKNGSRLQFVKRMSTSDTKIPIKYFTDYEERKEADKLQAESVKPKPKKAKKESDSKKKKSKEKDSKNKNSKPKQDTEETGFDLPIQATLTAEDKIIMEYEKNSKEKKKHEAMKEIEQNKSSDSFQTLTNSTEETNTEMKVTENGDGDPPVWKESTVIDVHKENPQAPNLNQNGDEENVDSLKSKIEELEAQLRASKKLKKKKQEKLLKTIAAQTKQISEKVASSPGSCTLSNLKMACMAPPGEEVTVPDGQIYVGGDKKFVKTEEVAVIDEMFGTFNQKAEALFKFLAGDCISKFSKCARGVNLNRQKGIHLKIMPKNVVASLTVIVKAFKWLEGDEPTHEMIQTFFRQQPTERRRRILEAAEKEKSEEDSGSERKASSVGKKVVSAKGNTTTDSSSDSDSSKGSQSRKRKSKDTASSDSEVSSDEEKNQKKQKKNVNESTSDSDSDK